MDTVIWMSPAVRMATLEIRIHLFDSTRAGAHVWADIRIKTWKPKGGGDFNVRPSEEGYPAR